MQSLLRKFDYTGKIAKWGTMLGAYDVRYMPRTAIKGQVLANFVAEFIKDAANGGKETMGVMITLACVIPSWEVYIDGAAN